MTRQLLTLLCLGHALLGVAHAQPSDATATADILFDEAKTLMGKGDFTSACPKLEASLKLDDRAIGTRINLAECYERVGRIASAWSMYRSVVDRARINRDPRGTLAGERAGRLEPRLPRLTILATGAPASLHISREGVALDPSLLGTQLFVDPGTVVVVASAPGFQRVEITVDLVEGTARRVEVPPLVPEPIVKPAPIAAKPVPKPAPPRDRTRFWAGMAVGGGGVVLVGGGLVFGLTARSAWDDAFETGACDRDTHRCNARGQSLTDRARTRAMLSTVLVGGGLAAIGLGAYLAITGPRHETRTALVPTLDPAGAGLAITGGF